MKFSTAFTSVLILLPILTAQASVVAPRQGKFGGQKGFGAGKAGKGAQGGQGANNKGAGAGAANAGAAAGAANATAGAGAAANSTAAAAAPPAAAANATAAAGANSTAGALPPATANNPNVQSSTTLDPSVIATGFEQDGQAVQEAGQVPSLTSNNNFINFCATVPDLPITNGKQITTGSCNPAPMGIIPSSQNMPSSKFAVPKNGDNFDVNAPFTITMNIQGMETGNFVNAQSNYFAAPQQINGQGQIIGHTHVVIEKMDSLTQTTATNPQTFAFFKGVNTAAVNGAVTADVTAGLPAGVYRLASINTAANHQPCLVPIAQHGSLDDAVYFTVGGAGANSFGGAAANATGADAGAAAANATAAGAAAGNATAAAGAGDAAAAGAAGAAAGAAGAAAGKGAAAGAAGAAAGNGAAATGAAAGKGAAAGAGAAAGKGAAAGAQGAGAGAAKGAQAGQQQKGQGKGRRSRLSREY